VEFETVDMCVLLDHGDQCRPAIESRF